MNYPGVEESEDAFNEINTFYKAGLLKSFSSYESVAQYLGCRPTLSRVGVIERVSNNKVKRRVIVDSAQSGVAPATSKPERVVLPRILDVVNGTLFQMAECIGYPHKSTEYFVLDFKSAFFPSPFGSF